MLRITIREEIDKSAKRYCCVEEERDGSLVSHLEHAHSLVSSNSFFAGACWHALNSFEEVYDLVDGDPTEITKTLVLEGRAAITALQALGRSGTVISRLTQKVEKVEAFRKSLKEE